MSSNVPTRLYIDRMVVETACNAVPNLSKVTENALFRGRGAPEGDGTENQHLEATA